MKHRGLLIDDVIAHGFRVVNRDDDRNGLRLATIFKSKVFVLDGVYDLLESYKEGKEKPIPKRPPFDNTWCEWTYRDEFVDFRLGALIVLQNVSQWLDYVQPNSEIRDKVISRSRDFDEMWVSMTFKKILRSDQPELRPGIIAVDPTQTLFFTRSSDHRLGALQIFPTADPRNNNDPFLYLDYLQSLPNSDLTLRSEYDPAFPWPPFMAFMLLSCKNVVTETTSPQPKEQRESAKHGRPCRKSYRVLKIRLPAMTKERSGDCVDIPTANDKSVRFHLCRGHFKNLQHERFKDKGWHWWPAHWRGSKALGIISKDYVLSAQEPAGNPPVA